MRRVVGFGLAGFMALVVAGVSVSLASTQDSAPLLPDVIEEVPSHLQVQNTQQREWLRFTTVHVNIGAGNLQIRGGGQIAPCDIDGIHYDQCTVATQELLDADGDVVATQPAGVALFHPEHNHWHQSAVAEFAVRRTKYGEALSAGVKITFCFVDVEFTGATGSAKKAQPRTYFECNGDLQGLASGWADSYHQSTPLQELDITGLAGGRLLPDPPRRPRRPLARERRVEQLHVGQVPARAQGRQRVDHDPGPLPVRARGAVRLRRQPVSA